MAWSGQRPYSSRINFTSRQRNGGVTVNERNAAAFIRHRLWRSGSNHGCRSWGKSLFMRAERPRIRWRRRHNASGSRRRSRHHRRFFRWRGWWRSWRDSRDFYGELLWAFIACLKRAVVECEVEKSRAWWVPLIILHTLWAKILKNFKKLVTILRHFSMYPT